MAVDVITAAEIRASRAVDLWDLLRFRVGVDVLDGRSVNNNRAIVSVRGFPREFVSSLLVLIDGRSVYMSDSGGVFWQQLPLQLQDIERIEIVRGPNAALHGSNAGLGVINIITKSPRGRGAEASVVGGNRGLKEAAAAVAHGGDRFRFRASHTFRETDGFARADGAEPIDFLNSHKANFSGRWTPGAGAVVETMAGGAWERRGDPFAPAQNIVRNDYQLLRGSFEVSDFAAFEVMGARGRREESDEGHLQYDAEALYRHAWFGQRGVSVFGASYRESRSRDQEIYTLNVPGPGDTQTNRVKRWFTKQAFKPRRYLGLTASASMENSDTGGTAAAYQAAANVYPHADHSLRLSYAVAPTIPDLFAERGNARFGPNTLLGPRAAR